MQKIIEEICILADQIQEQDKIKSQLFDLTIKLEKCLAKMREDDFAARAEFVQKAMDLHNHSMLLYRKEHEESKQAFLRKVARALSGSDKWQGGFADALVLAKSVETR